MSLLAPLYFLGALAISLPILFHLIRRQPKGQVEFSSLMFLRPTPPRLTRRSRLDNWLLLLIRALALMLLAAAFARPFLRSVALSNAELPGRRLVLVIDTSASMQRAGLWQQALDHANELIDDLQPADRLAIVTFDAQPKTLLGFDQSSQLTPEQRKANAKSLLREVTPTWQRTEVGRAFSFAGDLAVTYEPEDPTQVPLEDETDSTGPSRGGPASGSAHMILISDMQAGSELESLQVYAWPKNLRLDVRKVGTSDRTNAATTILAGTPETNEENDRVRVRVTNSADATESRFQIRWSSGNENASGPGSTELPVQVPPGQSRVVRMPAPNPGVTELLLRGDDHSFDNQHYLVSPQPEALSLIHIGRPANDPRQSLLYYLQRVPLSDRRREVTVQSIAVDAMSETPEAKKVPLVVLSSGVNSEVASDLREYVSTGGRLLIVFAQQTPDENPDWQPLNQSVNEIVDTDLSIAEAEVDDYVMLSRIDFQHPVFEPMADPKFNDFTKIRFWNHRSISGLDDSWHVVAHFDDGDPALIERTIGEGRVLVMAAGWQPTSSQLAMSTKFIPLVFNLFKPGSTSSADDRYTVGQPIDFEPSPNATITGPAGTAFAYRTSDDLEGIDQPGIYDFRDGDVSRQFAVNLEESESDTVPIAEDEFERFGVVLGKNITTEQARENQRQLRDQELEGQQKLWQWLIVAALALLGLEIFLGTKWSTRSTGHVAEQVAA